MLSEIELKQIFAEAEAIIVDDHFVYAKKAEELRDAINAAL